MIECCCFLLVSMRESKVEVEKTSQQARAIECFLKNPNGNTIASSRLIYCISSEPSEQGNHQHRSNDALSKEAERLQERGKKARPFLSSVEHFEKLKISPSFSPPKKHLRGPVSSAVESAGIWTPFPVDDTAAGGGRVSAEAAATATTSSSSANATRSRILN